MEGEEHHHSIINLGVAKPSKSLSGEHHPYFMNAECNAVHRPPDDEIPACSVPETAQQHGSEQVEIGRDALRVFTQKRRQDEDKQQSAGNYPRDEVRPAEQMAAHHKTTHKEKHYKQV